MFDSSSVVTLIWPSAIGQWSASPDRIALTKFWKCAVVIESMLRRSWVAARLSAFTSVSSLSSRSYT